MRICYFSSHSRQFSRVLMAAKILINWSLSAVRAKEAPSINFPHICMIFNFMGDSEHCCIWTGAKSCLILTIIYHSFEPSLTIYSALGADVAAIVRLCPLLLLQSQDNQRLTDGWSEARRKLIGHSQGNTPGPGNLMRLNYIVTHMFNVERFTKDKYQILY